MSEEGIKIPRLSESLSPLAWPPRCQRCGAPGGDSTVYERLQVWREHDDDDRPEMVFIVLCSKCADRLIEPHPRLYGQLAFNEPAPGIMQVCRGCRQRTAGRCSSPIAAANGGPGLRFPPPDSSVHVQRAGPKGRGRRCEWIKIWSAEPAECPGFEPREEVTA